MLNEGNIREVFQGQDQITKETGGWTYSPCSKPSVIIKVSDVEACQQQMYEENHAESVASKRRKSVAAEEPGET